MNLSSSFWRIHTDERTPLLTNSSQLIIQRNINIKMASLTIKASKKPGGHKVWPAILWPCCINLLIISFLVLYNIQQHTFQHPTQRQQAGWVLSCNNDTVFTRLELKKPFRWEVKHLPADLIQLWGACNYYELQCMKYQIQDEDACT